jgi:sugar lactone lactonase YvrE|tara:strand:+ start:197 stop:1039 length:843 start_codon:yes stop_codon:yes gene_type:complete
MAPDRIVAERGGFVPEGIEYDNNRNRFLTGSFADGTIYEVTSSGRLVPAITSPDLIASIGIEVDESRDTLYVANSNMGIPNGAAELGIYNLATGEQLAMVDLAASIPDKPADASHFANDVAVSKAGVAYVTDSNMKIVYKVDKYYRASVLIDFGLDAEFGLNGIEYHPAGYLILASPGTGQLIRVPVDNPQRWELIDLDVPATGVDGIVWTADGSLVGVSNNRSRAVKYASDDNWRSARLTGMASYSGQSTTGAVVGNEIYVIQPHFSDDEPPEILRAKF